MKTLMSCAKRALFYSFLSVSLCVTGFTSTAYAAPTITCNGVGNLLPPGAGAILSGHGIITYSIYPSPSPQSNYVLHAGADGLFGTNDDVRTRLRQAPWQNWTHPLYIIGPGQLLRRTSAAPGNDELRILSWGADQTFGTSDDTSTLIFTANNSTDLWTNISSDGILTLNYSIYQNPTNHNLEFVKYCDTKKPNGPGSCTLGNFHQVALGNTLLSRVWPIGFKFGTSMGVVYNQDLSRTHNQQFVAVDGNQPAPITPSLRVYDSVGNLNFIMAQANHPFPIQPFNLVSFSTNQVVELRNFYDYEKPLDSDQQVVRDSFMVAMPVYELATGKEKIKINDFEYVLPAGTSMSPYPITANTTGIPLGSSIVSATSGMTAFGLHREYLVQGGARIPTGFSGYYCG